jgi:hypothetical protein
MLKDATPAGVLLGSCKLATELDRLDLIDSYPSPAHPARAGPGPTLHPRGLRSPRRLELVQDIIAIGHHAGRLAKAKAFRATDIVDSHGEEAVGQVIEMTRGGAPHVLECVGATLAMETAIRVARSGGSIGYVGVPHAPAKDGLDIMTMFFKELACARYAYEQTDQSLGHIVFRSSPRRG